MTEKYYKYAKLLLINGLCIKKNQPLVITAPIESIEFIRVLTKVACELGVEDIYYDWSDFELKHTIVKSSSPSAIKNNCFWNIKKNCRARCLVHKNPYKSNNVFIKKGGNKNSKYIFWIWEETANEIKTLSNKIRNRFLQSSIELIKLREKYEYYGSNCNIGILNKAQNYLNKIKAVYKNEKII